MPTTQHALPHRPTDDQPIQRLEVGIAIPDPRARFSTHQLAQARLVGRMRIEQPVVAASLSTGISTPRAEESILGLEHLDDPHQRLRVIATAREVLQRQLVGLQLHLPTVATHQRPAQELRRIRHGPHPGAQRRHLADCPQAWD